MDFLPCKFPACLHVMCCWDLTLQIAAYCSGISSSLCLSIAGRSANDPLTFASQWIQRISNKGTCCSFQESGTFVWWTLAWTTWTKAFIVCGLAGLKVSWYYNMYSGVFFSLGEDAVAGLVPACLLYSSAIRAHVLSYNQDCPSSGLRQQPHPAQLRCGRHGCRWWRRPGGVCSWVRRGIVFIRFIIFS